MRRPKHVLWQHIQIPVATRQNKDMIKAAVFFIGIGKICTDHFYTDLSLSTTASSLIFYQ